MRTAPNPNDFKCSHGGRVQVFAGPVVVHTAKDDSGKGILSSGINKDAKKCQMSPHHDKHVAAADLAKKATKLHLDDLKARLGLAKMKILLGGGTTIAVAIDTTGSMGGAISQVKDQIIEIIDSRVNTEEEPGKYVLVPFNDPNIGPVTATDNRSEFKNALRSLEAFGGGDCPEFSMTGMLQALDHLDAGDELLMFTDASSKDGVLAGAVESAAVSKGVRISPVTFGSCSPLDPAFIRVADATGGQVFQLGQTEAGSITRLADFIVRSRSVDLLHISDTLTGSAKTYAAPVDSTMTRITFSVGQATNVVLRRPDGSQVQASDPGVQFISVTTGRIYSITNPTLGSWSIQISGTGNFSLRVSGESSLDFSYFRFVESSGRPGHPGLFQSDGFPQVNQTNTVMAQLSPEAATTNLELRRFNGTFLQGISTHEIGWANDDPAEESFSTGPVRQYVGDIATPSTPFRAYATGLDVNGYPYQRVVSAAVKPQAIRITAPAHQELVPGQTTTYTFAVTNFGPAGTFNIAGADDGGFLGTISPTSVLLGTNATQNVTASLVIPIGAGGNGLDTLTVTAQGAGASDAFNYATVQSPVRSTSSLAVDSFTATEVSGNNNGVVEAAESGSLTVQLVNTGNSTVGGIQSTVSALTSGVTINDGSSLVPNIEPAGIGINTSPFTFSLAANTIFHQFIELSLTVNYAGAVQPMVVKLTVPVGGVAAEPGKIVFSSYQGNTQEIYSVNANGDELLNLTNNPSNDYLPAVSPDSTRITFITRRNSSFERIWVMDLSGANAFPVTENANGLAPVEFKYAWSPDSTKLAYVRFSNFVAQISVVNADGSNRVSLTSGAEPAWSPDGTKLAFTRQGTFNNTLQNYNYDLFVMNADGSNPVQLTAGKATSEPTWSPDGTKIAFVNLGLYNFNFERHTAEINVMNADGSNLRQLTSNTISESPRWSPDGLKFVFASYRTNNFNYEIYVMNADGTSQVNLTNDVSGTFHPAFPPDDREAVWSPDGAQIAYTRLATDLLVINPDGSGKLVLTPGPFSASSPGWVGSVSSAGKASTSTNIVSSDADSTYGQSVTFTATVTTTTGTPQGNVQFFDGPVSIGIAPLSNGVASLTATNLVSGVHSLKAIYTETDNFLGSESTALGQTVAKAPLTVVADDKSKLYGDAIPTLTGSVGGIQNGDNLSVDYNTTATVGSLVGTYAITPAINDPSGRLSNYQVSSTAGTLTVSKAVLTITADNESKVYGAANPEMSAAYAGFVLGEGPSVLSGTLQLNTTATNSSGAGSYPIAASGQTSSNYSITYLPGTLTVGRAPLSIKAADSSRIYGAANPAFSVTYSGFVLNDGPSSVFGTLSFVTDATTQSNVGTYLVVPAGLNSANYNITMVSGTLTINRAPTLMTIDTRVIAAGSSTLLSAVLRDNFAAPIANRPVSLSLGEGSGAQMCSSITNNNGAASCTIGNISQPLGPGTISTSFAGDGNYLASAANAAALIFAYPVNSGGGTFVIGDIGAEVGNSVTFWGFQWSQSNTLSGGPAPSSFKGFANSLSTSTLGCAGTWTTGPGNSSGPPSQVPSYMAVIVSTEIDKQGSTIFGDIRRVAILRTNAGYSGNPGHAGTGTIVGELCRQ
jgi:Tol biopolymer transport system component